ncbi:MAG: YheV family putative metal-binding protein [Gammaproteobacteria bacterium]|uniref:YheV family putative zinc ribbon protein n=1 Tax=Pseudomaricurvus alcaniphilus TaxID=1166482 RepID=UPI0014085548|nr:YheV family putative zinc ribbon protein [Pseudomaricurvus alcaniphilus]MBR9912623.1 YheV family putative metal-binding protein [Gammaproteobacteria bacterium]NHN38806.1 YheV family putative metal-binding protein [Pseudomaricurvus alcaniphilus]
MTSDLKKRFIAGAVCPRCAEMDKIVVYHQEGKDYRECVSCGYSDVMHFPGAGRELETRVNKTEEEKKAEVQVIKFPASGNVAADPKTKKE